jgi:hypothetical protein
MSMIRDRPEVFYHNTTYFYIVHIGFNQDFNLRTIMMSQDRTKKYLLLHQYETLFKCLLLCKYNK